MVLLEACALGITPVATPNNGAIEIITDNKFGYISPTFDDPQILANTIEEALNNPIEPKVLRNYAQNFSSERIALDYYSVMTEMLK